MVFIQNKIGMSLIISHPEQCSVEDQIRLFAEIGFDSLFLSSGVTNEFERIPLWAELARSCNIEFEAVHAPTQYVDGVWLGDEAGKRYRQAIERIIELCSRGGVSKTVVHVGAAASIPVTEAGLDFWRKLEDYAKKRGVRLCYENSSVPDRFAAVIQQADWYHGMCHDIGHQFCYTPEIQYEKQYGNRILYTHIHDNYGMDAQAASRDMHLLPWDGRIDWISYLRELDNANYKGTLNLELSCFHSPRYRSMTYREFVKLAYSKAVQLKNYESKQNGV